MRGPPGPSIDEDSIPEITSVCDVRANGSAVGVRGEKQQFRCEKSACGRAVPIR
jgi:hypothetical protein